MSADIERQPEIHHAHRDVTDGSRLAVRFDAGLLSDLTGVSVNGFEFPRLIGQKPAGVASLACSVG